MPTVWSRNRQFFLGDGVAVRVLNEAHQVTGTLNEGPLAIASPVSGSDELVLDGTGVNDGNGGRGHAFAFH